MLENNLMQILIRWLHRWALATLIQADSVLNCSEYNGGIVRCFFRFTISLPHLFYKFHPIPSILLSTFNNYPFHSDDVEFLTLMDE